MVFFDSSPAEPADVEVHYEYEGFYPGSALDQISKADPDGGDHEPTDADYAAFENWAVQTYGRETWDSYRGTDREAT